MNINTKAPLAFASVLLAASCATAPAQGQVTHRRYEPPRAWTTTSCGAWKTTTYGTGTRRRTARTCVARYVNVHRTLPEWYLGLRDGEQDERVVNRTTWDACPERATYPACAERGTW
ncbi:hypothetical protein ABZ815_20460 [Nonomuraea sp. NPDC047529]|uniref:hypothetical protein n=1 Tax=Nonomuraea sp. NPDC047529 TaxID=3155623 RepID=UPI0033D975DD